MLKGQNGLNGQISDSLQLVRHYSFYRNSQKKHKKNKNQKSNLDNFLFTSDAVNQSRNVWYIKFAPFISHWIPHDTNIANKLIFQKLALRKLQA